MRRTFAGLNLLAAAIVCTVSLNAAVAQAADRKQSIEYELKVESAAQAAVWAIPAVAIWDVAVATRRAKRPPTLGASWMRGKCRSRMSDFLVYSMKTTGFLDGRDRVGLSSKEGGKMKANADGSVDVYFAPKPPAGLESNWIPTGEYFFLLFRLYGPEKPLFEKTWKLDDVEKVR
jgi:hypothetical protein